MIAAIVTAALAISAPDLKAIADQAIKLEGGSPLSANELVAMCLVESSGNPDAVGDGGRAVGLLQFHAPTWGDHADKGWLRTDPMQSMRVGIRYAKRGVRLCRRAGLEPTSDRIWSHHNLGNVRRFNAEYARRCRKALERL